MTIVSEKVEALVVRHDSLDVKLKDIDKKVEEGLYETSPDEA